MVTNRDMKSFGSRQKKFQKLLRRLAPLTFWSAFRHFGTHFAENFCMSKSSSVMDPTRSHEMPSCSAIDLANIRRSSKSISWIWSIIFRVVTVLGCPGRRVLQLEKSPPLNWATQFLTVAYNGACSHGVNFLWHLALHKKKLDDSSCWNRTCHLTCFLSASVTRKDLQFDTWTAPSFQQHYQFHPMTSGSRSS